MCGIFIAYNNSGLDKQQTDSYKHAIAIAGHRGPDNIGHFVDDNCFMGHSRLAILDLDKSSNQPFRYGDFVLTYNGEVFNYEELRIELRKFGHEFHTESDTEVVIAAYAHWGADCFLRFNGMWALAIYDSAKNELIISRDRFGQKPMFGAKVDGTWFFASEPQQLVHLVDPQPDYQTIKGFLEEGDSVKEGRTFFKNIEEFPPASYCILAAEDDATTYRYWDYQNSKEQRTDNAALEEFEKLLIDSVRLRLRSDVPVAICLSGGVDSTIITDMVRELLPSNATITAYTYKAINNFDESSFAREVATRLNCDIRVIEQPHDPCRYIEKLRLLVQRMGRGHSSPAIISNDCIHENISNDGFKVSIDGQGADELLAGYKTFYFQLMCEHISRFEFCQFFHLFRALMKQGSQFQFGVLSIIISFVRYNSPAAIRKAMRWIYGYQRLFKNFSEPEYCKRNFSWRDSKGRPCSLNSHLIHQHSNGLRNLIFYGDAVAMSSSVENRSPFLDHRLVDFVFSHDSRMKVCDGVEKHAIRSMSRYKKFADILDRNKVGFESSIRIETKLLMQTHLKNSDILSWPIFSLRMRQFVQSEAALSQGYERFIFRLFQVHLWNELFRALPNRYPNKNFSSVLHEN